MRNALLNQSSHMALMASDAAIAAPAAPAPAAPLAAEAAPSSAPALPSAEVSPPAVSTPAPVAPAAPSSPPAVEPAAPAAEAPAKASESPPSLLATADAAKREGAPPPKAVDKPEPAAEPKAPDATAPAAEVKPAEPAPAQVEAPAEKPPAPVFDAFKLPEGANLGESELTKFTNLLGEFETTAKVDHAQAQQFGQNLVDFYLTEVQRIGEQVAKHQVDVWNRLNEQRINEFKADPEIGGNRQETTLGNAKYVLQEWFGLKDKGANLLNILGAGGVANHVDFIRGLNNLYERFREPESVPANPGPLAPSRTSREPGQRGWYDEVPATGRAA